MSFDEFNGYIDMLQERIDKLEQRLKQLEGVKA